MEVYWSKRGGMKTIHCDGREMVSNAYGLHCAYFAFPKSSFPDGAVEKAEKLMKGKIMSQEEFRTLLCAINIRRLNETE